MNSVNAVAKAVLLVSGLAAMVLGARIGSAPDVFAYQLGLAHLPDTAIRALALSHGGGLLALGLFGVPALETRGRVFWGQDALPMLRAQLEGEPWFDSGAWDAAAALPVGVRRGG